MESKPDEYMNPQGEQVGDRFPKSLNLLLGTILIKTLQDPAFMICHTEYS